MENNHWIEFKNKCFCFTGDMLDIKRNDAKNEVKLRNGHFTDKMTKEVDYLIVGSIKNPDWKHGDYGNKIATAIEFREKYKKPLIIDEGDFMDALSLNHAIKDIHLQNKLIVIKYSSFDFEENQENLKTIFENISKEFNFILNVEITSFNEFYLFYNLHMEFDKDVIKYEYTLIKKTLATDDTKELISKLKNSIIKNLAFPEKLSIKDVNEGTSYFTRSLRKYPDL
jgi:hypothetical protein